MEPVEPRVPPGWVDASAPHRRRGWSRVARLPVRRVRRWYRGSRTGDLVVTIVCLAGLAALVLVGLFLFA